MTKQETRTWKGNPDLEGMLRPIADLHEDPANARLHPDKNLAAIERSYAEFGQQKPIVVAAEGKVLAGNGQFRTARALGWTHIAAVVLDADAATQAAYAIADNRTGETSKWDEEVLLRILDDLPEPMIEVTGWSQDDLQALAKKVEPPEFKEPASLPDSEGEPGRIEVQCPKCKHRFKRRK